MIQSFNPMINAYKKIYPFKYYIFIATVILIGNWYSIFNVKVLILDDLARYYQVGIDQFPESLKNRAYITPYIEWFFWKILFKSVYLARGINLFIFMIPLSCLFYYFFSNHLKLPLFVSIGSSILPNIIPLQTHIPAFVNGSYSVYGLLFVMIIFLFSLKIINTAKPKFFYITIPILIFISSQIMTQAIFLFPAFTFYILFIKAKFFRKIYYSLSCVTIILFKVIYISRNPYGEINKIHYLEDHIIYERINNFFGYTTIFNTTNSKLIIFTIVSLLLIAVYLYLNKNSKLFQRNLPFPKYSYKINISLIYLFLCLWIIGSCYVFIVHSKYFPARYLYITSFGVNCIILISIYSFFSILNFNSFFKLFTVSIIIFSLFGRATELERKFASENSKFLFLRSKLLNIQLKQDSQILITNHHHGTGGYWVWGTGYLQYLTNRIDISGHLCKELTFYDAFQNIRYYDVNSIAKGFMDHLHSSWSKEREK
jgi:hypothetical protein